MARIVYSSGPGGSEAPREPAASAEARTSAEPASQQVRVRRERVGRRGKTVSIAAPLALTRDDALKLLRHLKRHCGSGGTIRPADGSAFALEIQGDHADTLVAELVALGYRARRCGG
jgi:translation initiation factor 1